MSLHLSSHLAIVAAQAAIDAVIHDLAFCLVARSEATRYPGSLSDEGLFKFLEFIAEGVASRYRDA